MMQQENLGLKEVSLLMNIALQKVRASIPLFIPTPLYLNFT